MKNRVSVAGRSPAVVAALADLLRAFRGVAAFSAAVNLLMLAGPLYMLQIYDRVLASRSVPTLVALSIMLVTAYAFQAGLDLIRARIVGRAASTLDHHLSTTVHNGVLQFAVLARHAGEAQQPLRDLDQVRSFLTSTGPIAVADLPWAPLFLALCFAIHPWLGVTALAGAVLLFGMALLTERASRAPSREIAKQAGLRAGLIEADCRNAETIFAMQMGDALAARWVKGNAAYLEAVRRSTEVIASYGSLSRVVRMLLQSAMLGIGAYLVIQQELSGGAMIAASIMMGRALAPIETAIANWRGFLGARESFRRLSHMLSQTDVQSTKIDLPSPRRSLEAQHLSLAAPGSQTPIVKDVSFKLTAGECLGIIGPSGAGKSSLVRGLVGVWKPVRGAVLLDEAAFHQWSGRSLANSVGFLGQSIELFDGTVATNIARMNSDADSASVIAAAQAAGAHEMILRLPNGYDTEIGDAGTKLSAGQRQRIALARALFQDPFLIVLDEPNSNLDADGDAALQRAIESTKARGAIVVMIAHRPAALVACDKVLLLVNGSQQAFGPRDKIIRGLVAAGRQKPSTPDVAPIRVVSSGEPNS